MQDAINRVCKVKSVTNRLRSVFTGRYGSGFVTFNGGVTTFSRFKLAR